MPRTYRHVKQYEKEIFELKAKGLTRKEIAEKLGLSFQQVKDLIRRHNANQRKIEAGIALKRKGRPSKSDNGVPPSIQKLDKIAQLKYELSVKERRVKSLEAENELMRDFLSLTERK